jgi:hypothetical protein
MKHQHSIVAELLVSRYATQGLGEDRGPCPAALLSRFGNEFTDHLLYRLHEAGEIAGLMNEFIRP